MELGCERPFGQMLRLCLVLTVVRLATCQSFENFSKIHDDVLIHNPRVRPVLNYSDQLTISIALHLMSINSFDTVTQKLTSTGWMEIYWHNPLTMWNPADYGWAYVIYPRADKVWRPKLAVWNSLKELKPVGEHYVTISLVADGGTGWYPAEKFETSCPVDVTYFPFDTQRCEWVFFIWGEDIHIRQTELQNLRPGIDMDTYTTNGAWELISSRAWREELGDGNGNRSVFLHYEVTIRRRPSLLALTVLLPVVVLAGINVFVFTIPSESGERLSYAVTALLSFGVFMSFILDYMPSSTETLSIVAVNMSCLLVLSAVYVLCCVLSLRLFHRDDHKHPVPKSLQTVIVWLEVLVCLDPPSRNKVHVIKVEGTDASNNGKARALKRWRHDAYTDPSEMTWRRVSRTLDKLFFRFFFVLFLASSTAVWVILSVNYARNG
ncbi:hypothetical protein BaRGS_00013796 [Batillaria attramentaria]|uniref:Uncharacterized protein n=1 Tax=Batillaria attramentaria TaxID=370345 RepID=A0ABD0L6D2_9CAEN